MGKKDCLISIKNNYSKMTAAEKKIADFILKNSETVVRMSTAELANEAQTAKSAVIRFCKTIGFEGYSELKIVLSGELSKNKQLNFSPYIYPDDNVENILDKIFSANVKTLHDTAEKIDRQALKKAIDQIKKADKIYIYGVGTSAIFVNEFQYRLMQLGYNVLAFTDVASMKISTLNLKKGDVAIGISHSGRAVATVEAMRLAKENGAKTICLTSFEKSKITELCDFAIEVYSDEIRYPVEAISARIAHLSVIDTITIALSAEDYDKTLERSKLTHELVNTIRY